MSLAADRLRQTQLSTTVEQALLRVADEARLTRVLRQRLIDIARGATYRDIAVSYEISINTVKTEIRHLLRRLGILCRHEIDHAVQSAEARTTDGASAEHIHLFLRRRWA
ncbi:MAG: hypothetical protein IH957_08325 [Chloroflexi bacterium]|nr:hypothetical protein [Chloroflexota bacterium]